MLTSKPASRDKATVHVTGFPPVAGRHARLLILGSMPGVLSLEQSRYYAHPRNSFWHIIEQLFSTTTGLSYAQRTRLLLDNNIALWDVLNSCIRPGSLDTAIKNTSITVNDFDTFFRQHPEISHVFFNGARAEQEFRKRVIPALPGLNLSCIRLPSTSPAMASLNHAEKLEAWRVIRDVLAHNRGSPRRQYTQ